MVQKTGVEGQDAAAKADRGGAQCYGGGDGHCECFLIALGRVTRQQEKTPFESEEYMPDYRGVSIAPAAQNISGTSNQRDA